MNVLPISSNICDHDMMLYATKPHTTTHLIYVGQRPDDRADLVIGGRNPQPHLFQDIVDVVERLLSREPGVDVLYRVEVRGVERIIAWQNLKGKIESLDLI